MHIGAKVRGLAAAFLLVSGMAVAQDAHFSQQYVSKVRLNPAFTGLTAEAAANLSYRNQWPTLSGSFISNHLSGEMRIKKSKSAVGFVLLHDKAGSSALTTFELSGLYSYHTKISKNLAVSAGLQAGYGSRKVDFASFTFGDQLTDDGQQSQVSQETIVYDPVRYMSIGAGGILYSDQFWISIGTFHLNQPDLGFAQNSVLPIKSVINAGYKFYAYTYTSQNKFYELSFTPTATATFQGPFSKLDLGLYTLYTPVTVGILYRGLMPNELFTGNKDLPVSRENSIVFIGGVQLNQVKFSYSYDLGLSGISAVSGGAHEISLAFEKIDFTKIFRARALNKKYLQIACPAF